MWNWLQRLTHFPKRTSPRRRNRSRFIPVMEQLESRMVLAGNVSAFVAGNNLIVNGDNLGADITISQPEIGQITIAGNSTKVNGSAGPVTFSKVTHDVLINFGNGNDFLTFDETNPISISGNLSVMGGKGVNAISTTVGSPGALNVGGNLSILNLPFTTLVNLNVKGSTQVVNSGGDAILNITSSDTHTLSNIGSFSVVNSTGDVNQISMSFVNVKGSVQIVNRGATANAFIDNVQISGDLQINDGPGKLGVTTVSHTKVGRNLLVNGANGSLTIVDFSDVKGVTNLHGGNGFNTYVVDNATFGGPFQIQTGKGSDWVLIGTGVAFNLQVSEPVLEHSSEGTTIRTVTKTITHVAESGPVIFNNVVIVGLGDGDDELDLGLTANVTFKKIAIFNGEHGNNIANVQSANLKGVKPTLLHF